MRRAERTSVLTCLAGTRSGASDKAAAPRLCLDRLVITARARQVLEFEEAFIALGWHLQDEPLQDDTVSSEIDPASRSRGWIRSQHRTRDGQVFWIITQDDRSVTTIQLPDDS